MTVYHCFVYLLNMESGILCTGWAKNYSLPKLMGGEEVRHLCLVYLVCWFLVSNNPDCGFLSSNGPVHWFLDGIRGCRLHADIFAVKVVTLLNLILLISLWFSFNLPINKFNLQICWSNIPVCQFPGGMPGSEEQWWLWVISFIAQVPFCMEVVALIPWIYLSSSCSTFFPLKFCWCFPIFIQSMTLSPIKGHLFLVVIWIAKGRKVSTEVKKGTWFFQPACRFAS